MGVNAKHKSGKGLAKIAVFQNNPSQSTKS